MTTATIAHEIVLDKDFSPIPDSLLASPIRYLPDAKDVDASTLKFEKLADMRLRNSDTIILGGYGCSIKVRYDALTVEHQRGDTIKRTLRLDRGIHKIKQLVFTGHGGYITFDALAWCREQKITVILMNWKGDITQVLTPKQERNARLCSLQWQASGAELGLAISVELIRRKTLAQIATLERYPDVPGSTQAIDSLEKGLVRLHLATSIDGLRQLEGRLAMPYFSCFAAMPIKWERGALKAIPEHWKAISPRNSPLSYNGSGQHAVNPYHAALNFAYALLEAQVLQAIHVAGLDETVGFLHSYADGGKESLVFDLMEPFRAQVDAMVFGFFQKTTFKRGDFIQAFSGEARLNEELRRCILASCRVNSVEIDRLCRWLRSTLES